MYIYIYIHVYTYPHVASHHWFPPNLPPHGGCAYYTVCAVYCTAICHDMLYYGMIDYTTKYYTTGTERQDDITYINTIKRIKQL